LFGVEYDDKIAQVARNNCFNTITGNVLDTALMMSLPRPDVLHASPVCTNASNAKANGEESPEDIATADATCAYINHFLPDIFTLENVYGYRTFTAFAHILEALNRNGYRVDYWHLNAADYGVPQTRKRLILVAKLHGKPRRPVATHAEPSKLAPMFDTRLPWIGWYAAIEDLIDTLPVSKFADWQLERLPQELQDTFIMVANVSGLDRSFIGQGVCAVDEPSNTIAATPTGGLPRAFVINGTLNDYGASVTACVSDEPIYTMTGSMEKRPARAFIISNGNATNAAFKADEEPYVTVDIGHSAAIGRAWLSAGRVVKMTPRALARFQSLPDSYILPDKDRLACTVIGNAVPPLLYQCVIEAQCSNY
jgi:DNA (cytosine-5)-methyltransferase 1